jgi:hypothetical protein
MQSTISDPDVNRVLSAQSTHSNRATEVGCPAPPLFGRLQGCFEFFLAFEGPAPGVVRLLHLNMRTSNGLQRSVEGLRLSAGILLDQMVGILVVFYLPVTKHPVRAWLSDTTTPVIWPLSRMRRNCAL